MPNICNANIYIKGRKDCVDKFIQVLRENYNYGDDSDWKDAKHFFRIFEVHSDDVLQSNAMIKTMSIQIECAWSVYSCMFPGHLTYYNDFAQRIEPRREGQSPEDYDKYIQSQIRRQQNATNVYDLTRELNLLVEIVSEETEGLFFQEHYVIDAGKLILDEQFNIVDLWPSDYDEYLKCKEKYNLDLNINNDDELQDYLDNNGGIRPFGDPMWDATYIYDHSPYDTVQRVPMCTIVDKTKPHMRSNIF